MERNPVLALETDQVRVQPPETDRVMDQELGWESAEPQCHQVLRHQAFLQHLKACHHL